MEAPHWSGGPNGLLSRLQLWPPGLTKAPLGTGVEKKEPIPRKDPKRPTLSKSKVTKNQSHASEADLDLDFDVEAANRFKGYGHIR